MKKETREYLLSNLSGSFLPHAFRTKVRRELYLGYIIDRLGRNAVGIEPDRILADLQVFMFQCQQVKLNPLLGQIHARYDSEAKLFHIISIHSARWLAQQSGTYAGSSDTLFTKSDEGGLKAISTAYKIYGKDKDKIQEVKASALFDSYAPKNEHGELSGMWATHKEFMIGKVAEFLNLRKGWPIAIGQLYGIEELEKHFKDQERTADGKESAKQAARKAAGKLSPATKRQAKVGYKNKLKEMKDE